ncbi:SDR family NAD(P)-dependent oxidoreductase [Aquibacillus albus]|uniref:Benzil reductase ((S)-benzoin forming) n=1 Tax=Aquibacillus albus TaxID=1168171 RepID=A0ABS2N6G1_9BACI|nr:SDR family NAD(P)-dependent oxidoreductase [Aquibacillus albus]MBM7573691.1 benzil reductase ((S)-benzoin forming) [Aquibacillus albus]
MNHIIITGASKGLGKALAVELADDQTVLTLIGRNKEELINTSELLRIKGSKSYIYSFDLYNYDRIENLMDEIITSVDIDSCSAITLINNAGTINPINRFDSLKEKDIERNLNINCMAPILLMNRFLLRTKHLNIERRIINISSGVVKNPMYGWSLYSAAKSAIHSIIKTISKESDDYLVKAVSFDPGIMDTDMQETIRGVTNEQFKDVETFRELHKCKRLRNTKDVATIIKKIYINNWFAKKSFEKIGEYTEN